MKDINIPTYWECIGEEGNQFLTFLGQQYVEKEVNESNIESLLEGYLKEYVDFVDSPLGLEADAGVKEVSNRVIDFLVEFSKSFGIEEDKVVELWQKHYFKIDEIN